jgi:hypothetical protein
MDPRAVVTVDDLVKEKKKSIDLARNRTLQFFGYPPIL